MPYFKWKGVTLTGDMRTGYLCCPSQAVLDAQLFKQEIALLSATDCSWRLWRYRITQQMRADVFEQLTTLIRAGIRLPQALTLLARQYANPHIQEILFACAQAVHAGIPLSDVMQHYPKLFDMLAVQVITIGQESGNLAHALELLTQYMRMRVQLYQKLRSALAMPIITLFFVVAVALLIMLVIIPQFLHLFDSLHADIPMLTRTILRISHFVSSKKMLYVVGGIIIGAILVKSCLRRQRCRAVVDRLVLQLPGVGSGVRMLFQTHFFSSLSLLLQGNMPSDQALEIIAHMVRNTYLKQVIYAIAKQVRHGIPLSSALAGYSDLFPLDICTMIMVAEESASVPQVMAVIATQSAGKTDRLLKRAIMWLQPLLLLLLGLIIGTLIIAVYSPILQLSLSV